ncbi:hypothetical protein GUJ93_ZPchr0013g38020 [Zizania palustris]|uniref:Uncharacterized protein n=1 Tax=Zizania palustris TaxID=103762 RepID=A0A8J6BUN3_ZIZPA|nr:hypothetical protein GUJ93_ZPchr0013g38020 [Zizania palustris]
MPRFFTWKTAVVARTEERRWRRSSVYVLLCHFFPPGDGRGGKCGSLFRIVTNANCNYVTVSDRSCFFCVFGPRFPLLRPPPTVALSSRMDLANDVFRSLLFFRPRMGSHNSSQTDITPPEQIAGSKDSGGGEQRTEEGRNALPPSVEECSTGVQVLQDSRDSLLDCDGEKRSTLPPSAGGTAPLFLYAAWRMLYAAWQYTCEKQGALNRQSTTLRPCHLCTDAHR